MRTKKLPTPITILMLVIIIAAIATWLIPAGSYDQLSKPAEDTFIINKSGVEFKAPFTIHTLDSLKIHISLDKFKAGGIRKPISIPGSYHTIQRNGQGLIKVLQAPIKGIVDSIDIVLFLLIIGGFMNVFHETGALVRGLTSLAFKMKGKESWLIIILTFLFSLAGASYGMAEEALVFYPVMVPLFLAAGYDLLVPLAVIFGGTQLGTLSSFTNPFSTIIASNAAGVNWTDGLTGRIIMFIVSTGLLIWYIEKYARKIKRNPQLSLVYKIDGPINSPYENISSPVKVEPLSTKTIVLLLMFLGTFILMIVGVTCWDWWLTEMTVLFLTSSIIICIVQRIPEGIFIRDFIKGAENLVGVAFIVGVARGVTLVLNEGHISDSILFYSSKFTELMPPAVFIVVLLALYMIFTLFISSSSGMAVLTMPIIGALALIVNVPGREIVNSYLYGMGIMGFMTPTGLILPSLALVHVSIKTWWKFIYPLLTLLFLLCCVFLLIGIFMKN